MGLLLGRKTMTNLDSAIKKQTYHFADKHPYSQNHGFFQYAGTGVRVGP